MENENQCFFWGDLNLLQAQKNAAFPLLPGAAFSGGCNGRSRGRLLSEREMLS